MSRSITYLEVKALCAYLQQKTEHELDADAVAFQLFLVNDGYFQKLNAVGATKEELNEIAIDMEWCLTWLKRSGISKAPQQSKEVVKERGLKEALIWFEHALYEIRRRSR